MGTPAILVSNDDGVHAPGIAALRRELSALGDVTVVAPDRERSAASHSLTMDVPLRASAIEPGVFAVAGTPTDCILLAVKSLLPDPPDLVVSGINRGPNMGDDVTYSGTVAAAMEATLLGIPAMAVSLDRSTGSDYDYGPAAVVARQLAALVLERGLPEGTLLNVNVPNLPAHRILGVEIVRQGKQFYEDAVIEKTDPRGKTYYWIGGEMTTWNPQTHTDYAAVSEGRVAVTPVHLDLTDYKTMEILRNWPLEGVASFGESSGEERS